MTPAFLSVSVVGQNLAYGTLDLGATSSKPTGQASSTTTDAAFRVENNGTKISRWHIIGGNSEAWTIGPAAREEIYKHSYDVDADGSGNATAPTSLDGSTELLNPAPVDTIVGVWLQKVPRSASMGRTKRS